MARDFDGLTDKLQFDNAGLANTGDQTCIAVVFQDGGFKDFQTVLGNQPGGTGWRWDSEVDRPRNSVMGFIKDAVVSIRSTLALTHGIWWIIAVRVDVDTDVTFYRMELNDPLTLTSDVVTNTENILSAAAGLHGYIGSRGTDDVTVMQGKIAQVLHWTTLLSSAEIEAIMRSFLRNRYAYQFANLQCDFHLIGNSPEQSYAGGARPATVTGATIANHAPLPPAFGVDVSIFLVTPAGVTVAVSGTTPGGIDEDDMTGAPAETTILTLTGDTWVAAGATFDAQRQAILDGVTSAQSELLGWNNEVRDTALVAAVVRDSDTQVTLTWAIAQTANYDITATETIEVTVPAAALVTSLLSVVGTPTFTVVAVGAVPTFAQGVIVGAGAVTGQGVAPAFGQGLIAGGGTVTGQGIASAFGQGQIAGAGVVTGQGVAAVPGQGQIAGGGTVTGQGLAPAVSDGVITGSATVTGQVFASAVTQGAVAGQAAVLGQSLFAILPNNTQGIITGTATVTGQGLTATLGQGVIDAGTLGQLQRGEILGTAAVLGIGVSLVGGLGSITGEAVVQGISGTKLPVQGVMVGTSAVVGQSFSPARASGAMAGVATVDGRGVAQVAATGGV